MPASRTTLLVYCVHVTSWFVSFGMLTTFMPGYASTALGASANQVGLLQASFFIPSIAFLLVGGALADRYDRRLFMAVSLAVGAVSAGLAALLVGQLDPFSVLLTLGFALGVVNAFLNPSRDGMIPHLVAPAALPRAVAALIGLQFIAQILGIALAGRVDQVGPRGLLLLQSAVLAAGAVVVPWLPRAQADGNGAVAADSVLAVVLTTVTVPFRVSRAMTAAILSSAAVGICFVGSFLVIVPELVLKTHGLGMSDLSLALIAFTIGNLVSILALVVTRAWSAAPGRYLICAIVAGGVVLTVLPRAPSFAALLAVMLTWGVLAGVVMTTGRTLVQLMAGDDIRGRCLAMFQLGFFGASPVGALLMGIALTHLAPQTAGAIFGCVAAAVAAALVLGSDLWRPIRAAPTIAGADV